MGVCVVGGVLQKPQQDKKLFTIDWSGLLAVPIPVGVPVHDRLKASSWSIDAASPTSAVTVPATGFDDVSGTAWCVVDGGNIGDVVWLNNTVTTTGACVNGKNTPEQQLVRQIRIRVQDC